MYVQVKKSKESKSMVVANSVAQMKSKAKHGFGYVYNWPESIAQRKMQKIANGSTQTEQISQLQTVANYERHPIQDSAPIQRVRILLRDEDPALLGPLRQVPVPNQGAQTLQDPAKVGTLAPISPNESIIFEGHGYVQQGIFSDSVVSQGNIPPPRLAALARDVPKPVVPWTGDIYLMGCRTGEITSAVSKEYYLLTNQPVKVLGTKASIRVGRDATNNMFIGTDVKDEPQNNQPQDLDFVKDLSEALELYPSILKRVSDLIKQLCYVSLGQAVGISENLANIIQTWMPFTNIDVTSAHSASKIPAKNYKLQERRAIDADFKLLEQSVRKVSIFNYPDKTRLSVNPNTVSQEIDAACQSLLTFRNHRTLVTEIGQYFNGLGLKRIDLENPDDMNSAKKKITKTLGIPHWTDA